MRYWVYINDKVDGPYDEDQLTSVQDFTPDTLICTETAGADGRQEWVKASSIFDFQDAAAEEAVPPANEESLKTIHLEETPTELVSVTPAKDLETETTPTQLLIDKIDNLTREIEGLKTKVDQAVVASSAAQEAAREAAQAAAQAAGRPAPEPANETPLSEIPAEAAVADDSIVTNTESLLNHAEQAVSQAAEEEKGAGFLDEINIDAAKTENIEDNKSGEEVVLRSALDSLYNAKIMAEQTETEKEATFQDLLSPAKQAILAAGTAAAAAEVLAAPKEKGIELAQEPAQEPDLALQQPQEPAPLSEEQREEIINEITAPAAQEDIISQVIEQAQEEPAPTFGFQEEAPLAGIPEQSDKQETPVSDTPDEQNPLEDLAAQPQLSIAPAEEADVQAQPEAAPMQPQDAPAADMPLTPMAPEETAEETGKEAETVKELVPGKELETKQEDGILSQKDLDEAFTERPQSLGEDAFPAQHIEQAETPAPEAEPEAAPDALPDQAQEVPQLPAAAEEIPAEQQPQPQEEALSQPVSNANDMTEVELKEGSTYLISDFIPPAQAGDVVPKVDPGMTSINATVEVPATTTMSETIEEIVPSGNADDLEMSKVILENTIKMKRGASMDIKTVPMVNDPAESSRLDLTDSELNINAQHDIKEADFSSSSSKTTKIVLGVLVAIICFVLIYVMLAFLNLLPSSLNFIKRAPAAQQVAQQDNNRLAEMLPETTPVPANPYAEDDTFSALPAENGLNNQPAINPMTVILNEVKGYPMVNGQTLQQLINSRHPAARELIEWNITTAVEPDNYSVIVKVPPENPQSFKISYRFNYNTVTKALEPTISDSKNLLDSLRRPASR